jgi:integrase
LGELQLREQAMVMLAGSTGLRRSELFALRWYDVNLLTLEIAVTRSCVRNRFGAVKTEASGKPVPLHDSVREALIEWRSESLFNQNGDFLFSIDQIKRQTTSFTGYGAQEDHSARDDSCRHNGSLRDRRKFAGPME